MQRLIQYNTTGFLGYIFFNGQLPQVIIGTRKFRFSMFFKIDSIMRGRTLDNGHNCPQNGYQDIKKLC